MSSEGMSERRHERRRASDGGAGWVAVGLVVGVATGIIGWSAHQQIGRAHV